ncbi:hypothetical protein [Metaclostridioides mangenotii]|uniref:hypothetical protein n=1 Tax=Metaclostridioides mangenotii TaxID=1540 RepID=UPI0006912DCC|nr:hypothetical protein [Clostridioides mangenotii]
MNAVENYIEIVEIDEEYLMLTKLLDGQELKKISTSLSDHIKNCDKNGIRRPYSIGEIFTRESVENERFYNYKYFYTKLKQGENIKGAYKKAEWIL